MPNRDKTSLDYFDLSCSFFEDTKVQFVSARFGLKGEAILVRLLSRIYGYGFFYRFGKDERTLFAKWANIRPAELKFLDDVLDESLKRGFFDAAIFKQFEVLTSRGIQERYFNAARRRKKIFVPRLLCLIDTTRYENVHIIDENVDINKIDEYILKQIENENKNENESESERRCARERINTHTPDLKFFIKLFLKKGYGQNEAQAFWNYYKKQGFRTAGGRTVSDWEAAAESWIDKGKNVFGKLKEPVKNEIEKTQWKIMIGEILENIPAKEHPLFANLVPVFCDNRIIVGNITPQQVDRIENGPFFTTFEKHLREYFPDKKIQYNIGKP